MLTPILGQSAGSSIETSLWRDNSPGPRYGAFLAAAGAFTTGFLAETAARAPRHATQTPNNTNARVSQALGRFMIGVLCGSEGERALSAAVRHYPFLQRILRRLGMSKLVNVSENSKPPSGYWRSR